MEKFSLQISTPHVCALWAQKYGAHFSNDDFWVKFSSERRWSWGEKQRIHFCKSYQILEPLASWASLMAIYLTLLVTSIVGCKLVIFRSWCHIIHLSTNFQGTRTKFYSDRKEERKLQNFENNAKLKFWNIFSFIIFVLEKQLKNLFKIYWCYSSDFMNSSLLKLTAFQRIQISMHFEVILKIRPILISSLTLQLSHVSESWSYMPDASI